MFRIFQVTITYSEIKVSGYTYYRLNTKLSGYILISLRVKFFFFRKNLNIGVEL